ncbi:hypothetical protein AVEN_213667-1 [Araneus ventricosus]|uniref:Uncharacterized protein n=1 Tax=Araneus ventricosus TaxID=182803 RepID=A0A4Y2P193_ARAVE|nr:hypothetical protein AVEN_213667-1 [Araneus ventricosus]
MGTIVVPSAGLRVLWIRTFVNSVLDMTMDLTLLKTQMKSFRTSFTVCDKKIDDELLKEAPELKQLSILKSQLSDKFARLDTCQAEITNLILKIEDAGI